MEKKLCLFVCENFSEDVKKVIESENIQDVEVMPIQMNCLGPLIDLEDLRTRMKACKKRFHKVFCFGSSCLRKIKEDLKLEIFQRRSSVDTMIAFN